MNRAQTIVLVLGTAALLLVSGCSVHAPLEPETIRADVGDKFTSSGLVEVPERWWTVFEDSDLNALVDSALTDNLTLLQAWARLDQARALSAMSGSARWPQIEASAGGSYSRYGKKTMNFLLQQLSDTSETYSASVSIGYQVDIWNKINAKAQADILNFEASRKDIEATAMVIVSSIADIWFSIAEQEATLSLLNEQLKVNKEYLDLVELRFSQGAASAVEVYQQRLQLAATRNQIPQAELTLKVLRHQLAILLGKTPETTLPSRAGMLPDIPALPGTGIPADLLGKRPDLKAAQLRILSADRQVAVAIADQFPSLSFSLSSGANNLNISDLFDRWFVTLAGNLLGPVFDGGRRAAEVDRTRAVLQERLYAWKASYLTAIREVEDALASEVGQTRLLKGIQEQVDLAKRALERARARYVNGLGSYLNVLNGLQSLQQLERAEVSARRQLLSNRVKLYVALGGDWTTGIEKPVHAESAQEGVE